MTIFADSSELKINTRLPQSVIDAAQELPGLEAMTGADILISTLRLPPLKACDDSKLSELSLRAHIKSGLLVQRKSGRDLANSVPNLPDILHRMIQWTDKPWLLFIGTLCADRDGQAIIDGQDTGYTYNAVEGALTWWQLRGGMVTMLSREGLVSSWVNGWIDRLGKLQREKTRIVNRAPTQALVNLPDWVMTLATFPNIGIERARTIADFTGSLYHSIEFLSDPIPIVHLDGIGPETYKRAREFLGYRSDEDTLKISERAKWNEEQEEE